MAEKENKISSANADAKKKANSDKPGFFKRIGNWFKGLKSEFKKVTWASRRSTFKNFGIVLSIVIASAVVIGIVDIGLGAFFNFLLEVISL